jgi:hypothetical protein
MPLRAVLSMFLAARLIPRVVRPKSPLCVLPLLRFTASVKRSPFLLPWFLSGVFAEQPVTASIPATIVAAAIRLNFIYISSPVFVWPSAIQHVQNLNCIFKEKIASFVCACDYILDIFNF